MENSVDLLSKLKAYAKSGSVPMHMPGGKRNVSLIDMPNPYLIDITEIDGFDNLHHADGILLEGFQRAAKVYHSDESLFLVNGSSSGILAAICGLTYKGDKILAARNCHISVYHAILLNDLMPVYLLPDCDTRTGIFKGVTLAQVQDAVEKNPDIKCVVITSPTYEGIVSQTEEIALYLHEKKIPLIVDEAHGAHFVFHPAFPKSAVMCGADVTINSIHKTLPALTQTALLHLNGSLICRNRIKRYWDIYQTTSPSYVLMSSIDRCLSILSQDRDTLFGSYVLRLKNLRERLGRLKNIKPAASDDISKIVLICTDGKKLYEILRRKYKIQPEMASFRYVTAMTSIADTDEYYERFADALEEIDAGDDFREVPPEFANDCYLPEIVMTPAEAAMCADKSGTDIVGIDRAAGRISASTVFVYPPGIPVINRGEQITPEIIQTLQKAFSDGFEIIGHEMITDRGEIGLLCLR